MLTMSGKPGQGPQYLVVRSGSSRCAIPVAAAKLVAQAPTIIPLPGSKPRLLGLALIAGEPVAVVELQALLDGGGRSGGEHELTVVIRRSDGMATLGLAVDEAFGVILISSEPKGRENDPGWIIGRCELEDGEVVVLNPDCFYADAD
jgi:chemotaxis signal transduction protein